MTFQELIDQASKALAKKTNNRANNQAYGFGAKVLRIFGEEFGNQVYTKAELLKALDETSCEDEIGKFVYIDDLLSTLEEGRKNASNSLDN